MSFKRDGIAIVGAASVAEVGTQLALDSTLMSLAAFGSVLGLGVLHLRARRVRRTPDPSSNADPLPPDVIDMPNPVPAQNPLRDSAIDAFRELTARIDSLEAPEALAQISAACAALDARLTDAESRIIAQTARLEEAWTEGTLAAGDRSKEALGKLCRELSVLRADVQNATGVMGELRKQGRAPVALAEDQAALLSAAAEHGATAGRRLAQMSERIDTTLARIESQGEAAGSRIEKAVRATRERVDELARDASHLQTLPKDIAMTIESVEERLARRIDAVDASVRALPFPKASRDADILDAVGQLKLAVANSEARLGERVAALDPKAPLAAAEGRLLQQLRAMQDALRAPPETLDLAPVLAAMHALDPARSVAASEKRLMSRLDGIGEALSIPESHVDLAPVLEAIAAVEARIHQRVQAVERALPATAEPTDLGPVLEAIDGMQERLADRVNAVERAIPGAPEPTDLAPVLAAIGALEERVTRRIHTLDPARPLAASEERLFAELYHLRTAVAAPAEIVDLGPVMAGLRDVRARIDALPRPDTPEAFPFDALAAELRSLRETTTREILAGVKEGLDAIPRVDPFPTNKVLDALDRVRADIATLPRPEPAAPFPTDAVALAVREEIAAMPRLDPFPFKRILETVERIRTDVAALPRSLEPTHAPPHEILTSLRDEIAGLSRSEPFPTGKILEAIAKVRADVAALPPPAAPQPFPIDALLEGVRAEIAAIPRSGSFSTGKMLDAIASVRAEIASLPTPTFPVDAVLEGVRAEIASLPRSEAFPTGKILDAIAKVRAEVAALPPPSEAPAFPTGEIIAGVREEISALPRPEPFPTHKILDAIDKVRSEMGALPVPAFPTDAILEGVRAEIAALPRSEAFPTGKILDAIAKVRAEVAELPTLAQIPALPTDALLAAIKEVKDAVAHVPRAEAFPTQKLLDAVDKVRADIASLPTPSDPQVFPTEAILEGVRAEISALPRPEAFPTSKLLDAIAKVRADVAALPAPADPPVFPTEAILEGVRAEISALPRPEPYPTAKILDAIAKIRLDINALPQPEPAAPVVLDGILDEMRASEERLQRALHAIPAPEAFPLEPILQEIRATREATHRAIAALPRPEPAAAFPIDEIVGEVRQAREVSSRHVREAEERLRETLTALPRPDAFPLEAIYGEIRAAERKLHQQIAALPRPETPEPFPLEDLTRALRASEERLTNKIAAIPDEEISLAPVLDAIEEIQTALGTIPRTPPPFPLDAITGAVRAAERTLSERIAAIPTPEIPAPVSLDPVLASLERIATREDINDSFVPALEAIRDAHAGLSGALSDIGARLPQVDQNVRDLRELAFNLEQGRRNDHTETLAQLREIAQVDHSQSAQFDALHADLAAQTAIMGDRLGEATEHLTGEIARQFATIPQPDVVAAVRPITERADLDRAERRAQLAALEEDIEANADEWRSHLSTLDERTRAIAERFAPLDGAVASVQERVQHVTSATHTRFDGLATWLEADVAQRTEAFAALDARLSTVTGLVEPLAGSIERGWNANALRIHETLRAQDAQTQAALAETAERIASISKEIQALVPTLDAADERRLAKVLTQYETLAENVGALDPRIETATQQITSTIDARLNALQQDWAREQSELARRLDAHAAQVTDGSVSLHDAVEDLRAEAASDRRHVVESLSQMSRVSADANAEAGARLDALQSRIDKLARDIDSRLVSTQTALDNAAAQRDGSAKVRIAAVSESIVSGQGAFQAAVAEALDAAARRTEDRLAAAEDRLGALTQALERATTARDAELERRWAARFEALEARLVSALSHSATQSSDLPSLPRPRRQTRMTPE